MFWQKSGPSGFKELHFIGNYSIVVQISQLSIIGSGFYYSKDPGFNYLNIAITSVKSICKSNFKGHI